jgi:hypothetical protein
MHSLMDYQKMLQELQDGSKIQRKRKEQLDKEKKKLLQHSRKDKTEAVVQKLKETTTAQQRYVAKLLEGNKNSLRTLKRRLFFLWFVDKQAYRALRPLQALGEAFTHWLRYYKSIVEHHNLRDEEKSTTALQQLLEKYEHYLASLRKLLPEKPLKTQSSLYLGVILLTATLLLFKDVKPIPFYKNIYRKENRYNPLNPFFPFKF